MLTTFFRRLFRRPGVQEPCGGFFEPYMPEDAPVVGHCLAPHEPVRRRSRLKQLLSPKSRVDPAPYDNPTDTLPPGLSATMDDNLVIQEDGDSADTCKATLIALFPDMCLEYLERKAAEWNHHTDDLVEYFLGLPAQGESYTKRSKPKKLKRKRDDIEPLDEMALLMDKYDNPERRRMPKSPMYQQQAKSLISQDFPRARMKNIQALLADYANCLFPTYLALAKTVAQWEDDGDDDRTVFKMKKTATVADYSTTVGQLDHTIQKTLNKELKDVYEELRAARRVQASAVSKTRATKEKEQEEACNLASAKADGTVADCGCCFDEYALNRMVYCDGPVQHVFCIGCARANAEATVGQGKYEVMCMSTDGCSAGFAHAQQKLFIDDSLRAGLDRVEYEVVLTLAGIENLETCPSCPYAAECPPIEEDKEFRCANEDCLIVSCRLCKEETHVPKSCDEAARDNGVSARRQIEEAMSAALIRKCNKCKTPFIKEFGCNKMMCTRPGCHNIQCYICSKSCQYNHFNDESRGGKKGNCPLFDDQEKRHEDEVREAEEVARRKVTEENPDVDAEYLKFKMSERVAEDAKRRQTARAPHVPNVPVPPPGIRRVVRQAPLNAPQPVPRAAPVGNFNNYVFGGLELQARPVAVRPNALGAADLQRQRQLHPQSVQLQQMQQQMQQRMANPLQQIPGRPFLVARFPPEQKFPAMPGHNVEIFSEPEDGFLGIPVLDPPQGPVLQAANNMGAEERAPGPEGGDAQDERRSVAPVVPLWQARSRPR